MINLQVRCMNFIVGSGISFFNLIVKILIFLWLRNTFHLAKLRIERIYTFVLGGGGQIGLTCDVCRLGVPGVGVAGVNWGDVAAFASISRNIDRDCLPSPNAAHT